jgi:geranylgeranyl diphosphate synthase, type II
MRDFVSFLAGVRPAVDDALDRLLPRPETPPARLHEAMRYSVFAGGKRIRPALVVLAGETLGVGRAALLPGGAALEMIHTYSLIHDDLPGLDDDDLRRGRPTVHRCYDEATAILAGDALLTLGLTTLAAGPGEVAAEARRRAVATVGAAIGTLGMIGGQVDDLEAEHRWPADAPAALEAIHRRKTGALLVVCLRLAGIYAGADCDLDRRLTALGERLGLMFQIADDILDVEGTAGTLGKTVGKDAAARKLTYPGLYGLTESKRMLARTRDEALELAGELPQGGGLFPSLVRYLAARDR